MFRAIRLCESDFIKVQSIWDTVKEPLLYLPSDIFSG